MWESYRQINEIDDLNPTLAFLCSPRLKADCDCAVI